MTLVIMVIDVMACSQVNMILLNILRLIVNMKAGVFNMRVNDRGGFNVVLRNRKYDTYLTGYNTFAPEWCMHPDDARSGDDEQEMLDIVADFGLLNDDGSLPDDYQLVRVPWLDDEYADDDRFYTELEEYDIPAIEKFIFGNRDMNSINEPDPEPSDNGFSFGMRK